MMGRMCCGYDHRLDEQFERILESARELGHTGPMADEPGEPAGWTAYCAPGRKLTASMALMLRGERVSEIAEHPWLEGSTDVWLVNPGALELEADAPARLIEPLPQCLMCRGVPEHFPWCGLMREPERSLRISSSWAASRLTWHNGQHLGSRRGAAGRVSGQP